MVDFGIDSKKLEFRFGPNRFECLLGVIIEVEDIDIFNNEYESCLQDTITEFGIVTNRKVMGSSDINKHLKNDSLLRDFLRSFINKIYDKINNIDILYTRYNTRRLPTISVYYKTNPDKLNPVVFIRKISSSYPAICCWRKCSLDPNNVNSQFYIDSFELERMPAWDYIELKIPSGNLNVIYKGDQCNTLISTADLIIRFIDIDLKIENEYVNRTGLSNCMSSWISKINILPLLGWTWALKNMSPYMNGNIDISEYIIHPIVFIPKESPSGIRAEYEKKVFERLPIYDKLLNFLYTINGTMKHFEPPSDISLAQNDIDYLLIMGEKGVQLHRYLQAGGLRLNRLDYETL